MDCYDRWDRLQPPLIFSHHVWKTSSHFFCYLEKMYALGTSSTEVNWTLVSKSMTSFPGCHTPWSTQKNPLKMLAHSLCQTSEEKRSSQLSRPLLLASFHEVEQQKPANPCSICSHSLHNPFGQPVAAIPLCLSLEAHKAYMDTFSTAQVYGWEFTEKWLRVSLSNNSTGPEDATRILSVLV